MSEESIRDTEGAYHKGKKTIYKVVWTDHKGDPFIARLPPSSIGRCYRCLAKDHWVQECRDPIRCSACFRTGHFVRNCRTRNPHSLAKMHRAMQFAPCPGRCSSPSLKGFSNDFLIAHHSERDFVIFLPLWVRSFDLVRQGIVTLLHFQLRCYVWNPYRDATRPRITYKVWIKLVDVLFKCWFEARVATIVNSFGRYLWADEKSTNMHDLIGFRFQITIDDIAKIPENLAITIGDKVVNIIVQLESSAFFGGD
uniref:CCHC-type domain-containing protein n=1 Tax=Ananas comosus var. bracteatus TaxID=296719 RepID=A0A6V7PPY1_ANACO|nr:unnamed protein product [Ananas comosus var. bracteatus]